MTWPTRWEEEHYREMDWCPSRLVRLQLPGSAVETIHAIGQIDWPTGTWFLSPPALEALRNGVWGPSEGDLASVDAIRTEFGVRTLRCRTTRIGTSYPYEAIRWYCEKLGLDQVLLRAEIERTEFTELEILYDRVRRLERDLSHERWVREQMEIERNRLLEPHSGSQGEAR